MINLLYLGFVGFENIGDQVCCDAFMQRIASYSDDFSVQVYDLIKKPRISDIHSRTPLSGVVIGGGSLLQGTAFIKPATEAAELGLPLFMYGTGIDYFDEAFVRRLMESGSKTPAPVMFDGKEYLENKLRLILNSCAFIGVRGPLTKRCLSRVADQNAIHIIGDPGLVYNPGHDDTLCRTALRFADGRPLAAVNFGGSFGCIFGYDEQRTMFGLVDGIRHLIGRGYAAAVYPMWCNDESVCAKLCRAVGRADACLCLPYTHSADAVCTLLKSAALSIGFKLHSSVLSACMGTPLISLAYRSKCYDFALSVGLHAQYVSTSSFSIGSFIAQREADIAAHPDAQKQALGPLREAYATQHDNFFSALTSAFVSYINEHI